MATMTLVEFVWWALVWRAGLAPFPLVITYLTLGFAGLAAALVLRTATRRRSKRSSAASVVTGTILAGIGGSFFLPLKFAIPKQIPFWLDAPLAAAERSLFGADPWLLLNHLLGWALLPVDALYALWVPVQLLILFTVMLEPPSATKSRALIAYSIAWFLLGVVAATMLSSAGPIFYDRVFGGSEFALLGETLRAHGASTAITQSDMMWSALTSGNLGLVMGISAVPSLHVAISLWIFLTARTMAPRMAKWALIYFIFIWLASVQLGWHYVSDGAVGAIGMLLIWAIAGIVDRVLDRLFETGPDGRDSPHRGSPSGSPQISCGGGGEPSMLSSADNPPRSRASAMRRPWSLKD